MKEQRTIETFRIEIPREPVLRFLTEGKGKRPLKGEARTMVEEEFARAGELVDPRAVMLLSHHGLPGSAFIDPAMPLVAAVCTIAGALEERVSALSARGETARALVLDAIGSVAAEEVARRCDRLIREMAEPTDFRPAPRVSPGYGEWKMSEQELLFRFLDPAAVGVTLTENFMMVPRKSISFVLPLEGGAPGQEAEGPCGRCDMGDCPFRDPSGDGGSDGGGRGPSGLEW